MTILDEGLLLAASESMATETFGTVQETQGNLTGDFNITSGIQTLTHARQTISVVIPAGKKLMRVKGYLSRTTGSNFDVDACVYEYESSDQEPDELLSRAFDDQTITNVTSSGDRVGSLALYTWEFGGGNGIELPEGIQYFAGITRIDDTAESLRVGVMGSTVNSFRDGTSGVVAPDPFTDGPSANVDYAIWAEYEDVSVVSGFDLMMLSAIRAGS